MNPGTFYLYEYENCRRKRNVGFIKIMRRYRSCILQIRAGNLPLQSGSTLGLYTVLSNQEQVSVSQIAELNSCGREVAVRLTVSETDFPDGISLENLDGFMIRSAGKDFSLFWMASSSFFNLSTDILRDKADAHPPARESAPEQRTEPEQEISSDQETESKQQISPEQETYSTPSVKSSETEDIPQARKIGHEDLILLPKKFWPLASNSFLLHGFHNYGHLALIEENGRKWLGVPGIYDTREARAADLFGFPRFTRAYVSVLDLSAEERNSTADFGHWCRCVGICGSQTAPYPREKTADHLK